MSLFSQGPSADAVSRTVPEATIDWQGPPLRGHQYGRHRGTEYVVDLRPTDAETHVAQPGEILVSRKRVELLDDGGGWETATLHRGWPVEPGTYAALAGKRKKPGEKPMRAWDKLQTLAVMQRREPLRMATGPATSAIDNLPALGADQEEAVASVLDFAHRKTTRTLIEVGGNEPPQRSVAALVEFVEQRGVELSLARGRLLARSRTPIRSDVRELIEQARELIVGHLQGKPVMCCECAEPAVTIAYPDAPMCAAKHGQ